MGDGIMKNVFRSKIKCMRCGKNYRLKIERGKRNFICSGYHNKSGCTERIVISEDFLIEFINRRLKMGSREEFEKKIDECLDQVQIHDKRQFRVLFKNGTFMEMNEAERKIIY